MKIVVIGMGYVGLANALLLAKDNKVVGVDINENRVEILREKKSPIRDNEIEEYLKNTTAEFVVDLDAEVGDADLFIIATPTDYDDAANSFDTTSIESVIESVLAKKPDSLFLIKSTIPVGYIEKTRKLFDTDNIVFSPEFLREGKALYDNLHPSRIVMGEDSERGKMLANLFASAALTRPQILLTGPTEAEAIKLFSNTYLALRVAFFNELDTYAEVKGLSAQQIITGVGLDPRIGRHYNNPSFGFGGYCLPKDSKQLLANYTDVPQDIIGAIVRANKTRKQFIADEVLRSNPKTVGIYRLTMKTGSDNFRQSAILDIMSILAQKGVELAIYEPTVKDEEYAGGKVIKNLDDFANTADIILANRLSPELSKYKDKVYSRDAFGDN